MTTPLLSDDATIEGMAMADANYDSSNDKDLHTACVNAMKAALASPLFQAWLQSVHKDGASAFQVFRMGGKND